MKQNTKLGIAVVAALSALVLAGGWRCPILALTGHRCPGCGMSRAAQSLLRLDFAGAWGHNPVLFLLIPVTALSLWGWRRRWGQRAQMLLWSGCAALWLIWFLLSSVV